MKSNKSPLSCLPKITRRINLDPNDVTCQVGFANLGREMEDREMVESCISRSRIVEKPRNTYYNAKRSKNTLVLIFNSANATIFLSPSEWYVPFIANCNKRKQRQMIVWFQKRKQIIKKNVGALGETKLRIITVLKGDYFSFKISENFW